MKQYSLLELGWFDCYDQIRNYIEWLLKRQIHSSVLDSFKHLGVMDRAQIRNDWAGVLY